MRMVTKIYNKVRSQHGMKPVSDAELDAALISQSETNCSQLRTELSILYIFL